MAKLVCQSGPSAGHEYPLTKDVLTMGRQSSCDVQIMDHMSSRQHCQIRRDGKLFTLVDLGSRNGTQLNDKKVGERQLAFGDHIRVGECEWVLVKEPGDIELKDLLTKYEIQEKLGEGGMGVVYKANQKSMARAIALKILSPKYASRQRFVDQFIREARAAGQLNHPNIIQVHDVATENDIHYFSMEFVDGPTCMQLLRANGSFPVPEALEIGRQVAKALEYAHDHRLIHQDIKPDNIMIGANNTVKLADLGISKTFDEAEQQDDGPKRVMGTPHYMAPEAALGKKIDHRVDLYSLGATIYHLLTGKTPYTGTSATEVLKAQVMDPLPAIQDINDEVPDDVCALVERLMAKKPDDRYQKASEVADEFKRLQAGLKLGTDRIPSNETMILQRLAKGTPATSGTATPGEGSGHRTGGGTQATGEAAVAHVETRRLRLVVMLSVAAVIIFAAIMFLPRLPRLLSVRDAAPATGGPPAVAPEPPPSDPAVADPAPGIPAPDRDPAHMAVLGELETKLRADGERGDLGALADEVQRILGTQPGAAVRERAERLHARIDLLLAEKRRGQLDQAFAKLEGEVDKLVAERNYEVALARIKAFPNATTAELAPRVATLRTATTKAQDGYLADLRAKIKAYAEQKNAARLSDLRNALPAPFLGTPVEQEIVAALATIESEVQARHQALLKDVAADLVRWDLTRVEERHRLTRPTMGDSASGKQFDGFLAASRQLAELCAALEARLQVTGKQRFGGEIQKLDKPDLIGASRSGLKVQPAMGMGEVELAWKNIDPVVLKDVVAMVLSDEAGKFLPAIDVLASARALVVATK